MCNLLVAWGWKCLQMLVEQVTDGMNSVYSVSVIPFIEQLCYIAESDPNKAVSLTLNWYLKFSSQTRYLSAWLPHLHRSICHSVCLWCSLIWTIQLSWSLSAGRMGRAGADTETREMPAIRKQAPMSLLSGVWRISMDPHVLNTGSESCWRLWSPTGSDRLHIQGETCFPRCTWRQICVRFRTATNLPRAVKREAISKHIRSGKLPAQFSEWLSHHMRKWLPMLSQACYC